MRSNKLATFTAGTVSYLLAKAGREVVLLPKETPKMFIRRTSNFSKIYC